MNILDKAGLSIKSRESPYLNFGYLVITIMLFIIHVCIDDEICSHAESRREVQDSMLPQLKEAR